MGQSAASYTGSACTLEATELAPSASAAARHSRAACLRVCFRSFITVLLIETESTDGRRPRGAIAPMTDLPRTVMVVYELARDPSMVISSATLEICPRHFSA